MIRLLTAILLVAACDVDSLADVVKPKKGEPLHCKIIGYGKQKLIIEVDGQQQSVPIASVDSFSVGSGTGHALAAGGNVHDANLISLANAEVGQAGFFRPTLKVETTEEGRFIGSVRNMAVIIQGVDTQGLVTGRWVKVEQRMKVIGTENASTGQTLFVLEPEDASQKIVSRSEQPNLLQPVEGGVRVQDIRGR